MKTEPSDLRAYLLGKLPEKPAEELDARLFSDDDLHRAVEEERESLIEDYLQGRLSREEDARFRALCARSPELQAQVNSLRTLLVALDEQPLQNLSPAPTYLRIFFFVSPALAALLLIVSFLYLREIRENSNLHTRLQTLAPLPRPNVSPIAEHPAFLAFLSADVPRGPSALPTIAVPTTGSLLELEVEVRNPPDGDSHWDVDLLRGPATVWKSANVPLRRTVRKAYLVLFIDREDLLPGSYQVQYSISSEPSTHQSKSFQIAQQSPGR
jgi:hypothetical protein